MTGRSNLEDFAAMTGALFSTRLFSCMEVVVRCRGLVDKICVSAFKHTFEMLSNHGTDNGEAIRNKAFW